MRFGWLGRVSPDFEKGIPPDTVVRKQTGNPQQRGSLFSFRRPISLRASILLGLLCLALVFGAWWYVTRGSYEERIVPYASLPSPAETFAPQQLKNLWSSNGLAYAQENEDGSMKSRGQRFRGFFTESTLLRNLAVSLRRVVLGFALAAAVAIPLGVLCGCFPWVSAFFASINAFGRNIPIAALIPLTLFLFGAGEPQKIMFIFIAVAAFIMMDTASAIADISDRYIDTALTLGATRAQTIFKVLVPLAMPRLFNSLRLLFGIAFGYIMLIESINIGGGAGGIGNIINVAQRLGRKETIYQILIIIPAVALVIDRLLFMIQKSLFPHQFGGRGLLHSAWRSFLHACEDVKQLIIPPTPLQAMQKAMITAERPRRPISSA
jgi:ABC-type nitrate/sulfonate/bicarbonate transport system permease component